MADPSPFVPDAEQSEVAEQLAKQCTDKARKKAARKKSQGVRKDSWDKAREEVAFRASEGDWEDAKPLAFVALYALLHERIYGVEASDLLPQSRLRISGMASRMLKNEFGGDGGAMATFIRWTWRREQAKRKNGKRHFRIGPALQFNGGLLVEWRMASKEQGK